FFAGRIWKHFKGSPWRDSVQAALAPISIGLMASGVYALAKTSTTTPLEILAALVMVFLVLRTKINPTLLILGCAVYGALLLPKH
ncbi:MAG: chromate transporter, partial [Candidatus Eremiobacteraeota bacterium]|nr:chromate transporter [Candidatus Eremiobacteraeota bacterium]